jgi:hypothetical protein
MGSLVVMRPNDRQYEQVHSPRTGPANCRTGWDNLVSLSDVSRIARLRQRVSRAALSINAIGFLSAVYILVYLPKTGPLSFAVSLTLSVCVFACATYLAKALRAGDRSAAWFIAVWCLLWMAVDFGDGLPKAVADGVDIFTVMGFLIFTLPIPLGLIGAIAVFRSPHQEADPTAPGAMKFPFERGGIRTGRHPAFTNKRNLPLYRLLILVPLPYIFFMAARMTNGTANSNSSSQAEALGHLVGGALGAMLTWVPLTVYIYRRARRKALLPAAELNRKIGRPPVLYLRSFADDRLKMRARAGNGRLFLERLLKIRFEEVVTDHLWHYGPVVAIGTPGDKLPPLGAARDYLPDNGWQGRVSQLMNESSMIALVVGRTEGLGWELNTIIRASLLARLVLVLPPLASTVEIEQRWAATRRVATAAGLHLPSQIDSYRVRAIAFSHHGATRLVTTDQRNDWAYETALDAAIELIQLPTRGQLSDQRRSDVLAPLSHPRGPQGSHPRQIVVGMTLLAWLLVVLPQITAHDAKATVKASPQTIATSTPQPTTDLPSPEPAPGQVATTAPPSGLSPGEAALWSSLRMGGVAPDTCASYPLAESDVPGVVAAISCRLQDSSLDQPIWYRKFANAATMNGYMTMRANEINTVHGSCQAGQEADEHWKSGGTSMGRLVCVYEPANGLNYYKIAWASDDTDTVAIIKSEQPATLWNWWSRYGGRQFGTG